MIMSIKHFRVVWLCSKNDNEIAEHSTSV